MISGLKPEGAVRAPVASGSDRAVHAGSLVGMLEVLRKVFDSANAFFPAFGKKFRQRLRALLLCLADVGLDVDVAMFHDVGSFE